jgi:phosphatidyl-myo-inositol dimannoside synthase
VNRYRILMYSRYFPPEYSGAALQAIALAEELRKRGHQVEFVTQRWPGLAVTDRVAGFPVTRLQPGGGSKHRELRLWWNLAQFLWHRRGAFDFLHTHGAYYTDSIVGVLGRWFGLKSLAKASLANNDLYDVGKRSLAGRIHRAMLRRIDACIAISRDLEREFVTGGVPAERVHYLPNSVDIERFRLATPEEKVALRAKLGLPADRPLALYVGVFDRRKNIAWLMRQWREAGGFGTAALLVAVGPRSREDPDGSFKQALVELAASHPSLLRVAGQSEAVEDFYRTADVFVMPSRSEGLPNAVLEAMACGLPCVAADVSGTRELVVDGVTGHLFGLNDVDSLQAALTKALGEGAAALGAAARARVEREFAIAGLAERYEGLYSELLVGTASVPVASAPARRRGLIMVTELFLPTKGGTAVSFDDDFRRLGGKEVHIVTADVPGAAELDRTHPNRVHRLVLKRTPWLKPESLIMYWRLFLRTYRLVIANDIEAIFAGRALPEGIVAWAIARLRGCPVMIYAHGEELTGWGRGNKFKAMCFALRHADKVLANSDFTRDTLGTLIGVAPEHVAMTYPTIDVERYRPGLPCDDLRAGIGLRDGQQLVLSVGRLQRRKGFDQVVRSLPGLVARGLDVHYALIGTGEDREYLEGLGRDAGVLDRVHLLGHVSMEDLPRWYNACDLFAMPNRDIGGDTEGFGLVYLEAGACVKPVIAGRAGGTGSAVIDGVTGLRVDGEKVEAVEDAIAYLLTHPDEARRMGEASRARTSAGFTSDQRAAIIRQLITDTQNERRARKAVRA